MPQVLEHVYTPRGNARELFACRAPEVLLSGPAGTGKSRACLEKLHLCALLNPGMRGLILRKTATSLTSTALVTWNKHVTSEAQKCGKVSWYGGSSQEPAMYRYANGSTITVGGMDKATRIMSSEYDMIYVQEAIELTEDDWESATTRLRNGVMSFQQILADTNPDTQFHWLKVRCDEGKTVLLNSTHEENPVYFGEDGSLTPEGTAYIAKLDQLTGVRYNRLRKGLWVAAEGVIYEDFNPGLHVIDGFDPPPDWERIWSVDFGYKHPFVWQCWVSDEDGRLYLHREIYSTERIVADHAEVIKRVTANDPAPSKIVCDHDAEDRATLERALGMSTTPANKAVSPGIEAVQKRLRLAGDGRARIFIMKNSLVNRDPKQSERRKPCSTVEEIPGYIWDVGANRKIKDAPKKEDDDGCDAMRYAVAAFDLQSNYRLRWI